MSKAVTVQLRVFADLAWRCLERGKVAYRCICGRTSPGGCEVRGCYWNPPRFREESRPPRPAKTPVPADRERRGGGS